jgi:hypothetical protein
LYYTPAHDDGQTETRARDGAVDPDDRGAAESATGLALHEAPPDHSTISRTRRLIDRETHEAVFVWVLEWLAQAKLLKGTTLGVDGTTLEANAALRSIVRRDTGDSYQAFLTQLAKASGIGTPTRADLATLAVLMHAIRRQLDARTVRTPGSILRHARMLDSTSDLLAVTCSTGC